MQAEYFYPGFNGAFNEITNKEIKLWERIFVRAVETKEIRSDVNPSILALTFRILLFGKCFQDALVNGLRIEELKAVLYNQYELIKIELMKKDVLLLGWQASFRTLLFPMMKWKSFWVSFLENIPKCNE